MLNVTVEMTVALTAERAGQPGIGEPPRALLSPSVCLYNRRTRPTRRAHGGE